MKKILSEVWNLEAIRDFREAYYDWLIFPTLVIVYPLVEIARDIKRRLL